MKWKLLSKIESILGRVIILLYVFENIKNGDAAWFFAYVCIFITILFIKNKIEGLGSILSIGLLFFYYILKIFHIYYIDESVVTNSIILLVFIGLMIDQKPKYKLIKTICLLLVIPIVAYANFFIIKGKIIKDSYLEKEIVRCLDKEDKKITIDDLKKVDELYIEEVRKLDGIEHLKNLKKLEISCEDINDLSKLGVLTNLEILQIYDIKGNDLSFLKNLKKLKELYISSEDEMNFEPLLYLKDLKKLKISNNNLENIDSIGMLSSLEELDLSNDIVSAIKNNIKDLKGLKGLIHLKKLNLSYNLQIENLSDIECLTKLEELNISFCRVNDFKPLEKLKNLKVLNADDNLAYDIEIKKIVHPQNIKPVGNLKNLKELYINGAGLRDLGIIKNLKKLETLSAERNKIRNIEELKELTSLKHVNLNHNEINNIAPIACLKELEELDLGENDIENIKCLEKLTNLRYLDLSDNQIVNINALRNLKKLEDVQLYGNEIKDYSPIKHLNEIYHRYVKD